MCNDVHNIDLYIYCIAETQKSFNSDWRYENNVMLATMSTFDKTFLTLMNFIVQRKNINSKIFKL